MQTALLKQRWATGEPALGAWLALDSVPVAEAVGRMGFDYVCCDLQHGVADYQRVLAMMTGVDLGGTPAVARVPWLEPGIVGRLLDAGAQGIIAPMVNSASEAEAAVRACHYPPRGERSWGPTRAALGKSAYFERSAEDTTVVVMIETVAALGRLDEILAVPGVDAAYIGPMDLSISLGLGPGNHDDVPAFREALGAVLAGCRRHGVVPGIHANADLAPRRLEAGFRMVTVSSDFVGLRAAMHADLSAVRAAAPSTPTAY